MKLIDKLSIESLQSHDCPDSYVCEWECAFKAGFRAALELAAKKIKGSVNLEGIENPPDHSINCSLQAKHDHDICLKMMTEEE